MRRELARKDDPVREVLLIALDIAGLQSGQRSLDLACAFPLEWMWKVAAHNAIQAARSSEAHLAPSPRSYNTGKQSSDGNSWCAPRNRLRSEPRLLTRGKDRA